MRKVDHFMSAPIRHLVICTDFGDTLDLMSIEKDNLSVNNDAVICIFFVSYNWRTVEFKKLVTCGESTNEIDNQKIINDCDKWIYFGDTISKGKKNDHVFHIACLTYIIKYYDAERAKDGLNPNSTKILCEPIFALQNISVGKTLSTLLCLQKAMTAKLSLYINLLKNIGSRGPGTPPGKL